MRFVPKQLIRKVRQANLYRYLLENYRDDITLTASGLQFNYCDYPLWVGENYSGFIFYEGRDEVTGNALDCLMKFLDMTLQEAVEELLPYTDMAETYENLPKL